MSGTPEIGWKERCQLAEDARYRAERELSRVRRECSDRLVDVTRVREQIGGTFRKRDLDAAAGHELTGPMFQPFTGGLGWQWSDVAVYAGFAARGLNWQIENRAWYALPDQVRADSWHHLCAQVGLVEGAARVLYMHPEEGQESAVAKVKGVGDG